MVRLFAAPVLAQKSVIGTVLLAVIVIAAFVLARQFHQTAAAGAGPAVHNLAAPVANSPAIPAESPETGDSLNSSADDSSSASSSRTNLTVNGRDIPLPANGTVNQTTTDGSTTTTINAQTSTYGQGQASSSNSTSVNVQVDSHSSTESSL
jgi:hypothetical protein